MIGWIALYRTITDHWIWNTSSKRFQRWVDLLFLASWKNREVGFGNTIVNLKRGQIVTSIRQLMSRWKTNNSTVADTLKRFEDNGMIVCDRGRNMTIITIIHYNKYQRFAALAQSLADEQEQEEFQPPNSDDLPAQNLSQQVPDARHFRVQKQIPIEQDNNIIINNKQQFVVDDARAKEILNEFLNQAKLERGCITYRITPEQYRAIAEEIVNEWLFRDEPDWSFKHFAYTMRIKAKELNQKNNGKSVRVNKETDSESSREPNPLSRAHVYRAKLDN